MRDYRPLNSHALASSGRCILMQPVAARATSDSPALEVMTDLAQVSADSINASASLESANS